MKGTPVTKVYQVVVYHNVSNPEKLAAYAELAGPAMKSAGATFLARGIPYLVREEENFATWTHCRIRASQPSKYV